MGNNSPELPKLSRRDFLKVAGITLGSALTYRQNLFDILNRDEKAEGIDELVELGLGDYQEVWIKGRKFIDSYRSYPPVFYDLFKTLDDVVFGSLESSAPEISLLRDGWSGNEKLAVDMAEKYVGEVNIEMDSRNVTDNTREVKQYLSRVAESYPLHILALPKRIVIVPGGGIASKDIFEFTSPRMDLESAAVSFIHEATHVFDSFDGWKRTKAYANKSVLIGYIENYYQFIQNFVSDYLNLREDKLFNVPKVMSIWQYRQGVISETDCRQDINDKLYQWTTRMGVKGVYVNSVNFDELREAWALFIHRIGNKFAWWDSETRNKLIMVDPTIAELQGVFAYGYTMPEYGLSFEGLLGAVSHFLVGPVQSKWGGLPGSLKQINSNFMMDYDLELQRIRFNSLTQLPRNADFKWIRKSFGLPPNHPIGESVETEEERVIDLKRMMY